MKKTTLTLALALVAFLGSAQTDSVEVYRFTYDYFDSNVYAKRNYPDRMRLDIQKNGASEFYSEYGQAKASVSAINATGMSQAELMEQIEKTKTMKAGADYRIYRHFPEHGKLTVTDKLGMSQLYYTEEIERPEWMLGGEEKEICGYQCKKAEADFRGRHWTAWYAEELPMNNGPWKLGGLPGLIIEANDADDYFHFTCIGIATAHAMPTKKLDKRFVKCQPKDFARMAREFYADRIAFITNQLGGEADGYTTIIKDEKGNEIKSIPKEDHIYIEKNIEDTK